MKEKLSYNDLVENPSPRVPVCLVLDRSSSMSRSSFGSKRPIDELNEGVKLFFNALKEDEIARYSAEVAVVAFAGVPELIVNFDTVDKVIPPVIDIIDPDHDGTSIGSAVKLALENLEVRKELYKSVGVDYYQPWLVLMTDGQPTDSTHSEVATRVQEMVRMRKLSVFPIGIGDNADLNTLRLFSPDRPPLRLKGLNFKGFFEWLSKSVAKVSQSVPGEKIQLDIDGIKGWAEL
ncbi:MAG: VWA domain-containing protein [Candidatus Hydrogenedentes bacterium]|nr:VWA domain-containing protein [Candidatus Hydrogenedentota bacterium]